MLDAGGVAHEKTSMEREKNVKRQHPEAWKSWIDKHNTQRSALLTTDLSRIERWTIVHNYRVEPGIRFTY